CFCGGQFFSLVGRLFFLLFFGCQVFLLSLGLYRFFFGLRQFWRFGFSFRCFFFGCCVGFSLYGTWLCSGFCKFPKLAVVAGSAAETATALAGWAGVAGVYFLSALQLRIWGHVVKRTIRRGSSVLAAHVYRFRLAGL